MSLVRHPKSPFWYYSFMVNGQTYSKSTKTANKALAQKIENEARKAAIEDIHFEKKETVTLQELIDLYLESRSDEGRFRNDQVWARKILGTLKEAHTQKTIELYGLDASKMFHELATRDLFRLVVARKSEGYSNSTILQELLFFNGLMNIAKTLGYQRPDIDIRAFKKEQKLKPTKQPIRYLTADEEMRLLEELHPFKQLKGMTSIDNMSFDMMRMRQDAFDMAIALLDTGARYDEIASIQWKQIDLDNKIIHIIRKKVDNESYLHMTDRSYEMLKRRSENKDSEEYVFTNNDGGPRKYSPRPFQSALRRAGIEGCSIHTLRKTLASKLVRGGLAISDVSAILGHSTVTTTANYYASLSPAEASKRALKILN